MALRPWVGVRHPDGRVQRISAPDEFAYQACVHPGGGAVLYAGAPIGPPRIWWAALDEPIERTALTPPDSGARHPVWSWAGDRIAFTSDRASKVGSQPVEEISPQGLPDAGDIFTMDPDGGRVVQLTEGPSTDQRPTFSPDGNSVVFVSDRGETMSLWIVAADGTGAPEPLPYQGLAYRPWFSTDGRTIYCFCDIEGRHQVCALGLDDTEPQPLSNDDRGRTHGPFVDPSGEVLIVHSTRDGSHHRLYELPLDGGPPRQIVIDGVDHPMHGTRSRNGVLAFDVLE